MKRVLFVDDEPRILEGLQRMLRGMRRECELVFAQGGEQAIAECEAGAFDVIVSDMRMPGIDGATLLEIVRERWPATIRIVLSGHTEEEAALRAAAVAHQFLMKPSGPDIIRDVVGRSLALAELLPDVQLRAELGRINGPPSHPAVHRQVLAALRDEQRPFDDIVELLLQDPGLAAKVLQLVNSCFFAFSRASVVSVEAAAGMLGLQVLRKLLTASDVARPLANGCQHPWTDDVFTHSVGVAWLAADLCDDAEAVEIARTAGLLHDIGKLVLADRLAERYCAIVLNAATEGRALHEAEREQLGVTHAAVGAYLLGLWNLPAVVVNLVATHHEVDAAAGPAALALRAANAHGRPAAARTTAAPQEVLQ